MRVREGVKEGEMAFDHNEWEAAMRKTLSGVEREIIEKQFLPSLSNGWLCPACGRGNAPTSATCPCKPFPAPTVTC